MPTAAPATPPNPKRRNDRQTEESKNQAGHASLQKLPANLGDEAPGAVRAQRSARKLVPPYVKGCIDDDFVTCGTIGYPARLSGAHLTFLQCAA